MEKLCIVSDCTRDDINSRDLCNMHYARYRRHGDPLGGKARIKSDPAKALLIRSVDSGSCRVWTGAHTRNGYGVLRVGASNKLAHRFAYEQANGPVPPGLVIDHMCHNRACINIGHLRTVTPKQNVENNGQQSKRNKSGVRGVSWAKNANKWTANVCHNYHRIYLGLFDSIPEAEAAVIAKRNELFTHNDMDRVA